MNFVIAYGYLCEKVDGCTCGFGGYPYGHEPGCGIDPLIQLNEIEGWKEELEFLRKEWAAEGEN